MENVHNYSSSRIIPTKKTRKINHEEKKQCTSGAAVVGEEEIIGGKKDACLETEEQKPKKNRGQIPSHEFAEHPPAQYNL